ncbi:hypothetical protein T4D_14817 [Trichinella pseudospiralis]|uniref:Uncharacterized protein n=1 Tax=Trichinella pseudospiralis TaxID=6337 RepID=A0A0V1FP81_TRIPS|nr:hypothetical protein T4D_14817 [Trichinella pseudospiralis]
MTYVWFGLCVTLYGIVIRWLCNRASRPSVPYSYFIPSRVILGSVMSLEPFPAAQLYISEVKNVLRFMNSTVLVCAFWVLSLWKAHFNLSIIGSVLKRAKNEADSKYAENLYVTTAMKNYL